METIKLPKHINFEPRVYCDKTAAQVIHLNISEPLAAKLFVSDIENVLIAQANYLIVLQTLNKQVIALNQNNIDYLYTCVQGMNLNLCKNEILEIFDKEEIYLGLIGCL